MEWISVEDRLPELPYQYCIVYNENGYMEFQRAIWNQKLSCFVLYDPSKYEKLILHVTHWLPVPTPPRKKHGLD